MNTDIEQLKKDIAELEEYKVMLDAQQVTYPLDKESVTIIQKDLMVPTGNVILTADGPATADSLEVKLNGKKYYLQLAS